MGKEIERKFLVNLTMLPILDNGQKIKQGYIQTVGNTVIRIRLTDSEAWLTLKSEISGVTRLEFEYVIPVADAKEILKRYSGPFHLFSLNRSTICLK